MFTIVLPDQTTLAVDVRFDLARRSWMLVDGTGGIGTGSTFEQAVMSLMLFAASPQRVRTDFAAAVLPLGPPADAGRAQTALADALGTPPRSMVVQAMGSLRANAAPLMAGLAMAMATASMLMVAGIIPHP